MNTVDTVDAVNAIDAVNVGTRWLWDQHNELNRHSECSGGSEYRNIVVVVTHAVH